MTVATQHSTSPDHPGAPNMFARNIIKDNDFIKTFGNTATNSHIIEPRQTDNYNTPRGGNSNHINLDESSFDFELPSRADSPYQNHFSTLEASGISWSNEPNFRPFTPPNSESFSSKSWPYNDYQQGHPSNIFTNVQPASTREHYGQVTPPDDEYDNKSLLDRQLCEQTEQQKTEQQKTQPPQDSGKGKRKRISSSEDPTNHSPPKRTRKYSSRRSINTNEPIKPENVKRSKFLERNRVAASKCRQKKKEWTQNLESRARELQKDNSQLRMIVESYRQEVLFLKGELLKHSQCECESIQAFIKSGINNFATQKSEEDLFKSETSPIESMPLSRLGSIDTEASRHEFGTTSPTTESNSNSIADDENALEALLTSSKNHDTSNESIAPQVTMAAAV